VQAHAVPVPQLTKRARRRRRVTARWTTWWSVIVQLLVDNAALMSDGRHATVAEIHSWVVRTWPNEYGARAADNVKQNIRTVTTSLVDAKYLQSISPGARAFVFSFAPGGVDRLKRLL
jgi:hypothetical protein